MLPFMQIAVDKTWDGAPVGVSERVELELQRVGEALVVEVDAPFHADPRPPVDKGRVDRLWDWEVVEVFLLGAHERYLEIELGPHGHYLVLELAGRRHVERQALLIEYEAQIHHGRWHGVAHVPLSYLPEAPTHLNAYAIHGVGSERRFLAATPVPGDAPDFHRLEHFAPLAPDALDS